MAPLPKWKPRRTLIDLYNERDRTRWYWRGTATLSSFMIMTGFLVFPSSFVSNANITVEQNAAGVAAILLLALGYTLSVALWFICQSWLFQLDVIFLPCLSTCIFGLFNTIYNLKIHESGPHWTSSSISALALAAISTIIYAVLALLTFRKVHIVRSRDAMHRHTDGESIHLLPEDEQQRQQLMGLLVQRDAGKKVSPEASQSTFRIDLPDSLRRSTTHLTAPQNIYESRSRNYLAPLDRPIYPATSITVTNPTATSLDIHPMYRQPLDVSLDPHLAHMEGHLAPPHGDVGPDQNVAVISARYPDEKAQEAYGGGARIFYNGDEPHPLQRERAQYRMETEEEQEQRRRSASRESRRAEIEMSGRVTARPRTEMEGVETVQRIVRVETDGWGKKDAR
ncbi:hypothetical protein MMC07_000008 [Pseudocyphellaria aurata]|nr:hypothetical protein [Pseudocyphellaria aurata]